MSHNRTFPSDYTKEELADEIAGLSAMADSLFDCLRCLYLLSEQFHNAEDACARALCGKQLRELLASIAIDRMIYIPADESGT